MIIYSKFGEYLKTYFNAVVKKDEEFSFNCPRCGDTKRRFSFNLRLGISNCFKCGYRPRPYEFLKENTRLSDREILDIIQMDGLDIKDGWIVNKKNFIEESTFSEDMRLYPPGLNFNWGIIKKNSINSSGINSILIHWLQEQRIKEEDYGKFNLTVENGLRVVIPCYDVTGKILIYWLGRAIARKIEPRYMYPTGISRTAVFYGLERVKLTDGLIFVTEGWKDAYRMDGIALLGSYISQEQIKILKFVKQYYKARGIAVMLDEDAKMKGWEIAKKLVAEKDLGDIYFCNLTGLKDPGDGLDKEDVLNHTETIFVGRNGIIENRSKILEKIF